MNEATNKRGVIVAVGDWIVDKLDEDNMRKVAYFRYEGDEITAYMEDGGVMGIDEVGHEDIWLPGEKPGYN